MDQQVDAGCIQQLLRYGDVDHDGSLSLFDLFCILNGFGGDFGVCSFADDELAPCLDNGTIDIFDLFAVVNAVSGSTPAVGSCRSPNDFDRAVPSRHRKLLQGRGDDQAGAMLYSSIGIIR